MYLVDTNVLSAGAPGKADALAPIADWLDSNSDRLYLSTITIAEIESDIAKARADRLTEWLETVLHLYSARVLPLDVAVARTLGALSDLARSIGSNPGWADLAIAATAITGGHTVLTRNTRHFQDMPVPCHNPFASLPRPG